MVQGRWDIVYRYHLQENPEVVQKFIKPLLFVIYEIKSKFLPKNAHKSHSGCEPTAFFQKLLTLGFGTFMSFWTIIGLSKYCDLHVLFNALLDIVLL